MSKLHNIIVFMGPPGAGKGSLSALCVEKMQWVQLSTGNLCRKHIAEQTPLGKQIDAAIKAGALVSDELIIAMVNEWLERNLAQMPYLILDGYPRTLVQAQAFIELIKTLPMVELHVVLLQLSDEEVVKRLVNRYVCQNKECQAVYSMLEGSGMVAHEMTCTKCASPLERRSDDEIVAIKERLKTYYKHEQAMVDFYQKMDFSIKKIEVNKPLHLVYLDFKKSMGLPV